MLLQLPSSSISATVPFLQPPPRNPLSLPSTRRLLPSRPQASPTPAPLAGAGAGAGAVPSQSAVDTFWRWLGGATSPSPIARPGTVPEGLGLIAQRDVSRNEVVLEVPKKLWINSDAVAASEIGAVCGGLRPWVSISLLLLREKGRGEDSFWKPYLDVLPRSLDSTLFWSEEELLEIEGSQLLSTTLGVKEYVKSEFLKVDEEIIRPNKHLFPSSITLDDFLWAFGILRSRAFSRLRGENLVLIPLADLVNHNSSITTQDTWEIKSKGLFSKEMIFSLRSPVSVKAGNQVYIQYDLEKSNAEFALDYGFTETGLDRNAYTLTLEIPESDPFYDDKLDIAESNGLGEIAYFDVILGQSLPSQMIPYLRLLALGGTDAFLLEPIFRNSIWSHLELPVSRPNEESICKVVREACESALSSYSSTIEEDERLLESGHLGRRHGIAVAIRYGEKKILQQIGEIFQEKELELNVLEYYQERRLMELGLVGEQGEIVFWENN